ncbi:unnamed protein product [Cyclocybe aegerita]|uniref:Uncharacterized protein n=1 Tax=Cyclocybe aegerita TaxID=1973307 RepID=A0A8S0XZ77_CYCAE|nr:unnamed protein product [Cyclocybe aegerita]
MKASTLSSTTTKPPLKRRKLARSTSASTAASPAALGTSSKVLISTTNVNKPAANAPPTCISCHRGLNNQGAIIHCPICLSTTCAVCSRTCTDAAMSQPPTPHLTWSPTPSPTPSLSARRSIISLNSPNSHLHPHAILESPLTPTQNSVAGRRRKVQDDDVVPSFETIPPEFDEMSMPGPGCGRVVCRKCCYEDVSNNTTTCVDCASSSRA